MIEVNNLTTNSVDEEFLKRCAKIVIEGEKIEKEPELSIALVGQGRMREINKRYRKKNRVTDVLAFSDKELGLGEIIICIREVKKNAKKYNTSFEKELAKVLIHGILHLLGYDHEKGEPEAKKMREKEEYYLSQTF